MSRNKVKPNVLIVRGRFYLSAIIAPWLVASLGCSSQTINQVLFSLGEQANCASTNDNRIDERSRHATCLAETSLNHDFENYKKARESELAE